MIEDSRHSQTVKVARRENICTHSKKKKKKKGTELLNLVTICKNKNMQRKYLQVHLFGVMFHGGPV